MSEKKRMRGKSVDTLLMEALEDLNNYEHAENVDEARIQAARTRVITLKQRVAQKKKNKKADKVDQLRKAVKTLAEKFAALTTEVETLKQRLGEPVVPQVDPAATTLATLMADSTDANSRGLTTLERMRRSEQERMRRSEQLGGGGPPKLVAISGIPEHAFQPVRLTPPREEPRVEPRVETLAQPQPVIPPAEIVKKAIATSCSQFNDKRIQANVERIQAEARRNAPKSQVEAIEVEVTDERDVEEQYREAQERLARLRASQEQQ
jgi:regulator of replication initiation timing